jgi:hypothetical protein
MPWSAQCGRGIVLFWPWLWVSGILALTALVYLPGLHGPFLFDDTPNIVRPFSAWLAGQTGWHELVFGNHSGLLGRPLSMASFAVNAAFGGLQPLPFKITNLAIHLVCGGLIYALLARLLTRDVNLRPHARLAALVVSSLWLLHPMQVSTVLYVVQRMAQLSALFMLVALFAYVQGRFCLEQNRRNAAHWYLFGMLPVATLAAIFSKENGALVPLLCAAIEWGYFRPIASTPRPRSIKAFFLLFLALPAAAFLYRYGLHPERLISGYEGRLFTFGERLLSEPRALMDYMGTLLLPRGPSLGIYTDDFATSHGLLSPPTTLTAILGLVGLIAVAWLARARVPAFSTGIAFYLAGHTMESTVFPLELYFEHRNYLPSMGFFLAVVGLGAWLVGRVTPYTDNPSRTHRWVGMGAAGILAAFSAATFARANVWGSWPVLAAQGAAQHPNSMRAQLEWATVLFDHGRTEGAQLIFDRLARSQNLSARHMAAIYTAFLQCHTVHQAQPEVVGELANIAGDKLQLAEMLGFEILGGEVDGAECTNLSKEHLADLLTNIVDAAPQPAQLMQLWRTRFMASRLYLDAGKPQIAQGQAALAWTTGAADPAVGVFLANLYYINNDPVGAERVLVNVEKRIQSWDQRNIDMIARLRQQFDQPPHNASANSEGPAPNNAASTR